MTHAEPALRHPLTTPTRPGPAATTWRTQLPLLVPGGVAVVAGGLVAAVTGPAGWERGSWVAAFLVLVVGVAQLGLGAGPPLLASQPRGATFTRLEAVLWNGGGLAVIAGTLASLPLVVTLGSGLLLAALVMALVAVRGAAGHPALVTAYRALVGVLLVSIPIGIGLAWARA